MQMIMKSHPSDKANVFITKRHARNLRDHQKMPVRYPLKKKIHF